MLRRASSRPVLDLRALLDAVIFNVLIGNNDAHAKNFSLLHTGSGELRLAPLYDLVCTEVYAEIDRTLAMRVGRRTRAELVTMEDFEDLARSAELSPALVRRRVREVAAAVVETIGMHGPVDDMGRRIGAATVERAERLALRG